MKILLHTVSLLSSWRLEEKLERETNKFRLVRGFDEEFNRSIESVEKRRHILRKRKLILLTGKLFYYRWKSTQREYFS